MPFGDFFARGDGFRRRVPEQPDRAGRDRRQRGRHIVLEVDLKGSLFHCALLCRLRAKRSRFRGYYRIQDHAMQAFVGRNRQGIRSNRENSLTRAVRGFKMEKQRNRRETV